MNRRASHEFILLAARFLVGGFFIYFGLSKALHPVDFLKLLRQYGLTDHHVLLNLLAGGLPWFEVFSGLLLIAGVAVRGSALILLLMLLSFSGVVLHRALDIQSAQAIALCAIRFDCGCGGGEVNVCRKLLENAVLLALTASLFTGRSSRWCLRYELTGHRAVTPDSSPPPDSAPAAEASRRIQ